MFALPTQASSGAANNYIVDCLSLSDTINVVSECWLSFAQLAMPHPIPVIPVILCRGPHVSLFWFECLTSQWVLRFHFSCPWSCSLFFEFASELGGFCREGKDSGRGPGHHEDRSCLDPRSVGKHWGLKFKCHLLGIKIQCANEGHKSVGHEIRFRRLSRIAAPSPKKQPRG